LDSLTPYSTPYSSGLLLGFGLTGLLTKFSKVDLYQYLTTPNIKDANGVALMLGLGIAYRGKRDLGLSQMFTLHIPRLRHYQQGEDEVSPLVQAAAIVGLAQLFQASGHRHITETFLAALETTIFEITSEPLSLGIAISLVNLGMGDESSSHRESRERLCVIFSGNKSVDGRNDKPATFGNSDFFAVAPAAVLALSLGYMRTDHSRVKLAMVLPNDGNFVNGMLPDIVLLRTMAGLLIDSDPHTALNFAIPNGLNPEILASLVTGFAIACGLKLARTLNLKAFERLQTIARCLALLEKTPFDFAECPALRRKQCLAMVTLACSLVIAGTCDVSFLRFARFVRRRNVTTTFPQYVFVLHMIL
jgi:anaphase-promoting complex subunit 1